MSVGEPMSAFRAAIAARFPSPLTSQQTIWAEYAFSTNTRGQHLVDGLASVVPSWKGLRALDVGAGYGGACVAMAKAGASVLGIELDPVLLELSAKNLEDHPELSLRIKPIDAMDWSALSDLGVFDVITCDNVIEHVQVPHVLVAHLRRLLAPEGILYITCPNAFSFAQIVSDCHYGQFGLSLLDPIDGDAYTRTELGLGAYGVSEYRSWDGYVALFRRFGLHFSTSTRYTHTLDEALAELDRALGTLEHARATAQIPQTWRAKIEQLVAEHVRKYRADRAWLDLLPPGERDAFAQWLVRDYARELWAFVASPSAKRLQHVTEPTKPESVRAAATRLGQDTIRLTRRVFERVRGERG